MLNTWERIGMRIKLQQRSVPGSLEVPLSFCLNLCKLSQLAFWGKSSDVWSGCRVLKTNQTTSRGRKAGVCLFISNECWVINLCTCWYGGRTKRRDEAAARLWLSSCGSLGMCVEPAEHPRGHKEQNGLGLLLLEALAFTRSDPLTCAVFPNANFLPDIYKGLI